jgi:hypothetical protein
MPRKVLLAQLFEAVITFDFRSNELIFAYLPTLSNVVDVLLDRLDDVVELPDCVPFLVIDLDLFFKLVCRLWLFVLPWEMDALLDKFCLHRLETGILPLLDVG